MIAKPNFCLRLVNRSSRQISSNHLFPKKPPFAFSSKLRLFISYYIFLLLRGSDSSRDLFSSPFHYSFLIPFRFKPQFFLLSPFISFGTRWKVIPFRLFAFVLRSFHSTADVILNECTGLHTPINQRCRTAISRKILSRHFSAIRVQE